MANVNRPQGLRLIRNFMNGDTTGVINMYFQPASDATATAVGDIVKLTGAVGQPTNQAVLPNFGLPNALKIVTRITATTDVPVGVVVGFLADPTNLQNSGYRPASTDRIVLVSDQPAQAYEVQADAATTSATIGFNASPNIGSNSANGGSGLSGMQLAISTQATTSTLMLRIMDYVQRIDNDSTSTNAKLIVMFNVHQYLLAQTAGV